MLKAVQEQRRNEDGVTAKKTDKPDGIAQNFIPEVGSQEVHPVMDPLAGTSWPSNEEMLGTRSHGGQSLAALLTTNPSNSQLAPVGPVSLCWKYPWQRASKPTQ